MRSLSFFLAFVLCTLPATAVTDAERTQVYREFRMHFDAHRYAESLPLAQQLVSLTEEQYGTLDRTLVDPLTNVGTVYRRLGNHQEAEEHYERAVQILETMASPTDAQLLKPLRGLGLTYVALKQYEDAALVLRRAVDLSRNVNGLYNLEQLALLEPLIESYVALDRLEDAEKEHQYAFRIAETAYGKNDVRLLEPLDRYARWYEYRERYSTARVLHARALAIAERVSGKGSALTAQPLRGIARTHRLEIVHGPEDEDAEGFSSNGLGSTSDVMSARSAGDGERTLRQALAAIDKQQPVNHMERGITLVELGDWYLTSGATPKALENYRQAWKELELGGKEAGVSNAADLLARPRQLSYVPPTASVRKSRLSPEEAVEHYVETRFTVTREGRLRDVVVAESDASEALQKSVLTAVKKARYSPRLENGEPVETTGVTLRERVLAKE